VANEGRPSQPAAQLERDDRAAFFGHRPGNVVGFVGGEAFEISERLVILTPCPEGGAASGHAKNALVVVRNQQTTGNGGDPARRADRKFANLDWSEGQHARHRHSV